MEGIKQDKLGKRVCFLTGGTGGLGFSLALGLVKAGYRLFLTGRKAERLEQVADVLEGVGGSERITWAPGDLGTDHGVEFVAKTALEVFGRVDVLINNAGVFPVGSLLETSMQDYDACFNINVRAAVHLSRLLVPGMIHRGWGRILNIGSSSSYQGYRNTSLYCASKHALLGFSRSLHEELRATGVRAICISPGSIKTQMGRQVQGQDFETFLEPDDITRYLLFLLSLDGNIVSEEVRLNRVVIQ